MDPYKHAEISVSRRGGEIEDYLPIHTLMDSTKELISDNRHRFLHTLWGVRQVVIPIFGHTIYNSLGKAVLVKDICEQDHILPDYRNRFIPTLSDFVHAMEDQKADEELFRKFHQECDLPEEIQELMLSPLAVTGEIKSLYFTHNSWFVNQILPKIFPFSPRIQSFSLSKF